MKPIEVLLDGTYKVNLEDCLFEVKAKHRSYLYTLHLEFREMKNLLALIDTCRVVLHGRENPPVLGSSPEIFSFHILKLTSLPKSQPEGLLICAFHHVIYIER